ncbi:MAG: hypothetical protein WBA91_13490 [Paracoccaceae bacterium]
MSLNRLITMIVNAFVRVAVFRFSNWLFNQAPRLWRQRGRSAAASNDLPPPADPQRIDGNGRPSDPPD